MRILAMLLFSGLLAAPASLAGAAGPEPLYAGSIPAAGDCLPLTEEERAALEEYYRQKMLTVEGVILDMDIEGGRITIRTDGQDVEFMFDEATRFQQHLKPIELTDVKVGSKMAGLYKERDGVPYIGRVVIITGEQGRRRRR